MTKYNKKYITVDDIFFSKKDKRFEKKVPRKYIHLTNIYGIVIMIEETYNNAYNIVIVRDNTIKFVVNIQMQYI